MNFLHFYTASFVQKYTGIVYDCEIWRNQSQGPSTPVELTLDGKPLTIEWESSDIDGVLQGSTATLTVESPSDRSIFTNMNRPDDIWMLRVYRDGALYWTGCLDMEGLEEPYAY